MRLHDRGFSVLGAALLSAVVFAIGLGAAVYSQQAEVSKAERQSERVTSGRVREGLGLEVSRNPQLGNTAITLTNKGSVHSTFSYLVFRDADGDVVAGPVKRPERLVGWWRFGKESGDTVRDYSWRSNQGVMEKNVLRTEGWLGDGAIFSPDSPETGVRVEDQPSLDIPYVSVFLRFKLEEAPDSSGPIVSKENSQGPVEGWSVVLNWDRSFVFSVDGEKWAPDWQVPLGAKRNYGFVYSESGVQSFYVDGKLVDNNVAAVGSLGFTSSDLWISAGRTSFVYDEVMVFGTGLSGEEMSDLSRYNTVRYSVGLNPREEYTVTYPYLVDENVVVGTITGRGNVFWEG